MIKFLFDCLLSKPNRDKHWNQLSQRNHSDGCFRGIQQKKDSQRYGQYGYTPLHPQPAAITVGKFSCFLAAHRSFCAIAKKMIGLADDVAGSCKQPAKQQHKGRYQNSSKQTCIKHDLSQLLRRMWGRNLCPVRYSKRRRISCLHCTSAGCSKCRG